MLHHSVEASLVALAVAVALVDTCQHYLRQPSVDVANLSVNLLVSVTGGLLDSHLPARAPERYTVYWIVSSLEAFSYFSLSRQSSVQSQQERYSGSVLSTTFFCGSRTVEYSTYSG